MQRLRVEVQQDPSDTLRDALAAIDEQWLQGRSRRFTLLLYLLGAVLSLSLAFLMILQLRHLSLVMALRCDQDGFGGSGKKESGMGQMR